MYEPCLMLIHILHCYCIKYKCKIVMSECIELYGCIQLGQNPPEEAKTRYFLLFDEGGGKNSFKMNQ